MTMSHIANPAGENAYRTLQERGFFYQVTDEAALLELFGKGRVTAYIGFDSTADSLHVGHLLPLMALSWLARTGHRPIALLGGGTSMVGDPSGRKEARKILSLSDIRAFSDGIRPQLMRFIGLAEGRGILRDNADWLANLNYIEFMRDIGRHFSVNRMLTAESYRARLEGAGLSFLEFNYMVMQAYDFLVLFRNEGCSVQMGGQDQWGNILAGIELIRREEGGSAHGVTMPLLIDPRTNEKFGKTNSGAVWLSKGRTAVYDFYQFWRNVDDQECGRLLLLFTFLPKEECRGLSVLPGRLINRAKEILAYEVTQLCHGHGEAREAYLASLSAFGPADPKGEVRTSSLVADLAPAADAPQSGLPTMEIGRSELESLDLAGLFAKAGLASSKSEARRLIRQGGAYLGDCQVPGTGEGLPVKGMPWLDGGEVTLRFGKKRHRVVRVAN
ncbi:MAG: tyrosine--tRNA ligase [Deltaproteobacteria bacterium]|jgi:tyrosyl-tRNA synthetase|nr:tyrosine--tRNA ligase [Deltaproteobacteria bacterium]